MKAGAELCELTARHLSDEELDDVLIGALVGAESAEAEAHLAACGACRARKEVFLGAVAMFNQASMAWSEARSHTLTRDLAGVAGPSGWGKGRWGEGWAWPAAAMVVVFGAMAWNGGLHERMPARGGRQASNGEATQVGAMDGGPEAIRRREIAADDAMLRAIDSELGRRDPSPGELYGWERGGSAEHGTTQGGEARD